MTNMRLFEISPELSHELASLRGKGQTAEIEADLDCPEDLVEKIVNLANGNNFAKLAVVMAMTNAIIQKVAEQRFGGSPSMSGATFDDMVHLGTPIYEGIIQDYFDESKKNRM